MIHYYTCEPDVTDYILVQQDVDSICAWFDQNLLLLNTLKFCYLLLSRKPTPSLLPSPLFVSDTILHMAKQFIYLGVTFSSDAAWSVHVHINNYFPES